MTLDPQLTIIRSHDAGADFYDFMLTRMRSSISPPEGLMFHFSGNYGKEFFSVSAYRDVETSMVFFSEFTGPEFAAAVLEAGGGPDISRDEFLIVSYAIHDDEGLQGFTFTDPGEFIAVLITDPDITLDRYIASREIARFPREWPAGLVVHVAGEFGKHLGVFDIWHADADLAAFYGERLAPAISKVAPEIDSTVEKRPSAIVLHSLYLNSSSFEGTREYLRWK